MAPEVISQKHYDSKADIWSLGITALELAQGRAPRSRDPPYKVLLKTYVFVTSLARHSLFILLLPASRVEDEPPTLDREGGQFKYSKAFKEIIQSCLMKDPARRHVLFFSSSFWVTPRAHADLGPRQKNFYNLRSSRARRKRATLCGPC